jgi:hypothetical protein
VAQPAGTPPVERVVKGNLTLIKMKCDVHPWMTGWISVTNHPWFAVTGESGRFEIKDVPVGTYKLEAWHEKFGSKTVDVTVTADKPAEVKFAYDGTEH